MRVFLFLLLTGVVLAIEDIANEDENVVNQGTFPYMAFLYYPDDTIVDVHGIRITKGAVLIRLNWLISSFFENSETSMAFPKKTLLARLGAIKIDVNFTLNEDENEQEQEIIQISRPYNFNTAERWLADICLLKTLLPFTMTPAVATVPAVMSSNVTVNFIKTSCFILVFSRLENTTDKILMKGVVNLLQDNCGTNFKNDTMLCSTQNDENSVIFEDPNFCQDNNGGPLICDNKLTGIQTYVDDCKQPYLYQSLSGWENFLNCAIEEKCLKENCATVCVPIYKDIQPNTTTRQDITTETERVMLVDGFDNKSRTEVSVTPTLTTVELVTSEQELTESTELTVVKNEEEFVSTKTTLTTSATSTFYTSSTVTEDPSPYTEDKLEVESTLFAKDIERKTHVEAQQHTRRNNASTIINNIIYYFISVCLLRLT